MVIELRLLCHLISVNFYDYDKLVIGESKKHKTTLINRFNGLDHINMLFYRFLVEQSIKKPHEVVIKLQYCHKLLACNKRKISKTANL